MARPLSPSLLLPSPILFESTDRRIVVIDVPRSIEDAQVGVDGLHGEDGEDKEDGEDGNKKTDGTSGTNEAAVKITRCLLSSPAPDDPFPTPPNAQDSEESSLAAPLAELIAQAAMKSTLAELRAAGFDGPWCLPRRTRRDPVHVHGEARADADAYYIPPGARYLSSTITAGRRKFLAEAPPFDLIVLDPPWPNRSARRRRQGRKRKRDALDGSPGAVLPPASGGNDAGYETAYDMASLRQLLDQIPVGAKLAGTPGGRRGLVAVWITNKPGCVTLLTDPKRGLFRSWGVELVATWTWLKVTTRGEPVTSLDSPWRKPWERLLLARRPVSADASIAGSGRSCAASALPLPPDRVIVGVPDVHSRKPNLRSLLAPFLLPPSFAAGDPSQEITGLEVFARNLAAGWWSWGNEVLLFQHKNWWVEEDDTGGAAATVEEELPAIKI